MADKSTCEEILERLDKIEQVLERINEQIYENRSSDSLNDDVLIGEAIDLAKAEGYASSALFQRKFSIGYARAARLLDILEEKGIIGPADGARPRDIL